MEKYNYFYHGLPINKDNFLNAVPNGWENEIDEFGHYSYGYYSAEQIDIVGY